MLNRTVLQPKNMTVIYYCSRVGGQENANWFVFQFDLFAYKGMIVGSIHPVSCGSNIHIYKNWIIIKNTRSSGRSVSLLLAPAEGW